MNTVNLIGNIVANPELRGQNSNVANFRIAVQRPFKTNKPMSMKLTSSLVLLLAKQLKLLSITLIKVTRLE